MLRNLALGITFLLVAAIIYLSLFKLHIPAAEISNIDKAYHFIAYGGLMWWLAQLYGGKQRFIALLLVIALGIIIEYIQPYTGREFDVKDMLANSGGAIIAWLTCLKGGDFLAKKLAK